MTQAQGTVVDNSNGNSENNEFMKMPIRSRFTRVVDASTPLEQDTSSAATIKLLSTLPRDLKRLLPQEVIRMYNSSSTSTSPRQREVVKAAVQKAIGTIVKSSSTSQSIKGFFTAGVSKSAVYLGAKVMKRIRVLV